MPDPRETDLFDTGVYVEPNGVVRWKETKKVPTTEVLMSWYNDGKPFNLQMSLAARKIEDATYLRSVLETTATMIDDMTLIGPNSNGPITV